MGTRALVVGYSYTPGGQLNTVTYPSGRVVSYSYEQGLLKGISLAPTAAGTARTLVSGVQYSPFGPARSWQWNLATGPVPHERVFDSAGRLVRYPLGKVVRDLSYDAADRISGYTHYDALTGAKQPSLDQLFFYDELGRLIGATQGTQNWIYAYDANGNRTQASNPSGTRLYTIEPISNRLSSLRNPLRSFSYDAAGNTLSDTGSGYGNYTARYNLEGRLSSVPKAQETVSVAYDVSGLRVAVVQASARLLYAFNQRGQLLGEYSEVAGVLTPKAEYVWMDELPIAVVRPKPGSAPGAPNSEQELFFLHPDHLGAPRVALDLNGQLRWRWMGGEPFGVLAPEENPSNLGPLYVGLRFPGQVVDSLVGLHYNVFRDYDPTVGRYVQSDPIGLKGGINTYAYVSGNPVSNADPRGLDAMCGPGGLADPSGICRPHPTEDPNKPICVTGECAGGIIPVRKASPAACFTTCFALKTGGGLLLGGGAGKLAFSIGPKVGALTKLVMSSKTSLTVSELLGIQFCAKECDVKIEFKSECQDTAEPEPFGWPL